METDVKIDLNEIVAALQEVKKLIAVLKVKGTIGANDVKDIDLNNSKVLK